MRKVWMGALVLQALVVLVILALAYAGALPIFWYAWPGFDLLGHAALFGMLAVFADRALRCRTIAGLRLGPALVLLFAAAEECLQALSPQRTASPWDLLADVVGVVVLCWLADVVVRYQRMTRSV
ncbi:MAG: VanZ family protein [Chloroflexi bacterium]|nr:VanZ family protein [Chloroflexota bacterium]MBU1749872.1 VanZ family protein [Chloroflexota bacterium]MBU1877604.1 VanZ family protein [Chloroflexota bacterium]